MPGRIQTNPVGLLALLGLKTSGANPSVFPDHVQGVVDLTARYELAQQELVTQAISLEPGTASNTHGGLRVPTGEVWRLLRASVFVDQVPSVTAIFSLFYSPRASLAGSQLDAQSIYLSERESSVTSGSGQEFMFNYEPHTPWFMTPGSILGVRVASTTGGVFLEGTVSALISRHPI